MASEPYTGTVILWSNYCRLLTHSEEDGSTGQKLGTAESSGAEGSGPSGPPQQPLSLKCDE